MKPREPSPPERQAPSSPAGAQETGGESEHVPQHEQAGDDEPRCDLCGAPMLEWHCRIVCTFCGYQRDCSDP
jgi:hypothetical protein